MGCEVGEFDSNEPALFFFFFLPRAKLKMPVLYF